MTDAGMTAEEFTPRLEAALERWLDYCSRLTATELVWLSSGTRVSARFALSAGDVSSAGLFDALGDLIDEMAAARAAMDEENTR